MRKFAFIIFFAAAPQIQRPPVVHIQIPPREDPSHDYENWRIELTAGYWPFSANGNVKTRFQPGDLHDDLGVRGYKSHPYLRIIAKPARKHELLIEGIPYRVNGGTNLTRPLDLSGRTYAAGDEVTTKIKLNSVNLEYRYDIISKNNGALGLIGGGGYLDSDTTIRDVTRGIDERDRVRVAFPYLGAASRGFLHNDFRYSLNGEIKGMHFGNNGYYLQSYAGIGISPLQIVTLRFGYGVLRADVHNKFETQGVKASFRGPTISIQWRDR